VAGSERVDLRRALECLRNQLSLMDNRLASAVAVLLSNICASVAGDEHERKYCKKLINDFFDHWGALWSTASRVETLMGRFELRGRCLVERGVGVEDPAVCEGGVDGGLLIIGRGMQALIGRDFSYAVHRVDGVCTMTIGDVPDIEGISATLERGRGLIWSTRRAARVAVGPCSISDLPRLAEAAAELAKGKYSEIYERCSQRWRGASEEERRSCVLELVHRRHVDLLKELGGGEGA
jgi:hypothetical protein